MNRLNLATVMMFALAGVVSSSPASAPTSSVSEYFDGVVAPGLPPGWAAVNASGSAPQWATSASAGLADTPPNFAFANDPITLSDRRLETPTLLITAPSPLLSFRHNHDTESGADGGVLEVSIDGGAFADVITAGGSFVLGAYTGTLSGTNPIAGRSAWTGNSSGYKWTIVNLPGAAGQSIKVRFRMTSDASISGGFGWRVDTITIAHVQPGECGTPGDFDGDLKADPAVWRSSDGFWHFLKSSTAFAGVESHEWGANGDNPLPSDFDGDWKTDMTFFRPPTGVWWSKLSSTNIQAYLGVQFGASTDVPAHGDYDADCKTDPALFRPSSNNWFIRKSTTNYIGFEAFVWGQAGDVVVPADYDGDGRTDLAVWRPSTGVWWVLNSATNYMTFTAIPWGGDPSDVPLTGDFDGDGKADRVVFRRSTGVWWVLKSSDGTFTATQFGASSDSPVPADFNGDRITDIAVWRGSSGVWYVLGQFAVPFGLSTDIPVIGRH